MIKLFSYIVIIFLTTCIISCVDENITPVSGNVTAHLYDCYSFPGPIWNTFVSVGSYPLVIPDGMGNSELNASSFPYEFSLYYLDWNGRKYQNIYDRVTRNEVYVSHFQSFEVYNRNLISVIVQHQNIHSGKTGFVKFISSELFEDYYMPAFLDSSHSSNYCWFYVPYNKNSISGKIIYIEESTGDFGVILSYDKFGMKEVTLNTNSNSPVVFSDEDVQFNPEECNLFYEINIPGGLINCSKKIYLHFDGCSLSSDFELHDGNSGPIGEIEIPKTLPCKFNLKLFSKVVKSDLEDNPQEKWMYFDPTTEIIMDNSDEIKLYNPATRSIISDSTIFSYDTISNYGLYFIRFYSTNAVDNIQNFITSKNHISLGELKKAGIIFTPNLTYYWCVNKPSGFSSVDEFLSHPYQLNPSYTSKIISEARTFKTAQ